MRQQQQWLPPTNPFHDWTAWQPFPLAGLVYYLHAPFGPGVYQLRRASSGQFVLFGTSKNVAWRMASLLPSPMGTGTRRNAEKQQYVLDHLDDIDYRTLACPDMGMVRMIERGMKDRGGFLFPT